LYTVNDIAGFIEGKVIGDGKREVYNVSAPEEAEENSIIFIKEKTVFDVLKSRKEKLSFVMDFEPPEFSNFTFIIVEPERMDEAFIKLLTLFDRWIVGVTNSGIESDHNFTTLYEHYKKDYNHGKISQRASISEKASIGQNVTVGDFVRIEEGVKIGEGTWIGSGCYIDKDCSIGQGCIIYPNVTIYHNTILEDRVILHSGAVIGSDGFGYSKINGQNQKIPQIGGVYLEKNVEIGANTTVDRATLGYTRIGENTKIDNLVHIGHNVIIGKNTVICALTGVSGSVKIGNNVLIAGAVGLKDHIVIEDDVYIAAKSGVMDKVVKKGRKIVGIPASDFRKEMEFYALKPRLKKMFQDIQMIKKKLGL